MAGAHAGRWAWYVVAALGLLIHAPLAGALEAFDGTCGALNPIVCNDDFCGLQSTLSFPSTMGQTYYVRMGGGAYSSLSDEITGTTRRMALVDVFRELARKFQSGLIRL